MSTAARATAILSVAAGVLLTVPPAQAATSYHAPLRTAVRQLPVAAEDNAGYDRDRSFGAWTDADRDCHNTRAEVLAQESAVRVGYSTSSRGCTVSSGRWYTVFDAKTYTSPKQVQIDHLVPVAEAWGSGARAWSQARRVSFYNDLGDSRSLNAMASALNSAKGAKGPEDWLPPANRCRYLELWTAVKIRWSLRVDARERATLLRLADGCPNRPIKVTRA